MTIISIAHFSAYTHLKFSNALDASETCTLLALRTIDTRLLTKKNSANAANAIKNTIPENANTEMPEIETR